MTLRRRSLIALAAAAVALAACGGGEDASTSPGVEEGAESAAAATDESVAATVNGTEISRSVVDERVDDAAASPQLSEMLAADETGQARAQLSASVLSQLIVNQLVLDGAEEMGLEVDDEAIDATREELVAEVGGEEAFAAEIEAAGLDEDELREELKSIAALRLVREELTPAGEGDAASTDQSETEADPSAAPSAEATTDPADAALEQWLLDQVQEAEIEVDREIGTWDPQQATVIPAGAAQQAPGGAPVAPEDGSTAPEGDPTAPAAPEETQPAG